MTNNGQLEHTDNAHWVMAIAQALGAINKLAERQENIVESSREALIHEQRYLAKEIARVYDGNYGNPETVAARDIERTQKAMQEYQKDIERHETLLAAYRAAAAIIEAATGEYYYAARDAWHHIEIVKFQTEEARAEWLEKADPYADWRVATDADLQHIYYAQEIPTPAE